MGRTAVADHHGLVLALPHQMLHGHRDLTGTFSSSHPSEENPRPGHCGLLISRALLMMINGPCSPAACSCQNSAPVLGFSEHADAAVHDAVAFEGKAMGIRGSGECWAVVHWFLMSSRLES